MAPVWEANHVWVIFAVVVLFTAFPPAFALMSVVLHVPLTLMLVGIVLRGSAFVFRQYGFLDDMAVERWGRLFAAASVITPFCLGAILGTITSGQLPLPESLSGADLFVLWLRPFPLAVALLTVALFTFLAAVYLTNETDDTAMQDSFRRRAFLGAVAIAIAEVLCGLALEHNGGPFHGRLTGAPLARALQGIGGLALVVSCVALAARRYRLARAAAIALATLIFAGWAYAQYPYLVAPHLTISSAAAPPATQHFLIAASAAGMVLLIPSLYFLLRVFKSRS
jgi:cytochrome d ubiquinol oxidase subunit II